MTLLASNKSSLSKLQRQLQSYQQFLPALDLKRKQLLSALTTQEQLLLEQQQTLSTLRHTLTQQLALTQDMDKRPLDFLTLRDIVIEEVNFVGVMLPRLGQVKAEKRQAPYLCTPIWHEALLTILEAAAEAKIKIAVAEECQRRLHQALRKTTQRINLFERVLIPRAQQHMKKIHIVLSDNERAAVVAAKLAKRKRQGALLP